MTHDATNRWNYTFDQEDRITGATGFTYTYDADGNRVAKSNVSMGTLYWYMSPGIVAESDIGGNLQSEYVFLDGERVAWRDLPGGVVSYYVSDHLKTTDIVTDAQGNIKNESDFYPWGGELQFPNTDTNHYKFTGKERDSETGLDYFGARYYSNGLARFITPDWSATPVPVPYADLTAPQTLNQYTYVRNIPTSKADPDGHCPPCGTDDYDESLLPHDLGTAAIGFFKQLGNIAIDTARLLSNGRIDGGNPINGHDEKIGANAANVAVAVLPGLGEEAPVESTVSSVAGAIEGESAAEGSAETGHNCKCSERRC